MSQNDNVLLSCLSSFVVLILVSIGVIVYYNYTKYSNATTSPTTQASTTTPAPSTTQAPITTPAPATTAPSTTTPAPATTAPSTTQAPITTPAPSTTSAPVAARSTTAPPTTQAQVVIQTTSVQPVQTTVPPTTAPPTSVTGRYVKLVGLTNSTNKLLNIGEIRVFAGGLTNIAKNKPVTMSSQYASNFSGANLVDERDDTFAHTAGTEDPWMLIDLGVDSQISKIVVTNRKDCCGGRSIGSTLQILDSAKNVIWTSKPFTGQNGVTSYLDSYQGNPQYVAYPPSTAVSDN